MTSFYQQRRFDELHAFWPSLSCAAAFSAVSNLVDYFQPIFWPLQRPFEKIRKIFQNSAHRGRRSGAGASSKNAQNALNRRSASGLSVETRALPRVPCQAMRTAASSRARHKAQTPAARAARQGSTARPPERSGVDSGGGARGAHRTPAPSASPSAAAHANSTACRATGSSISQTGARRSRLLARPLRRRWNRPSRPREPLPRRTSALAGAAPGRG